jgi:hypothetical protein
MTGSLILKSERVTFNPMAKSIKKVTPKKRGRPATGKDPVTTFRVPDDLKLAIREAQPDKPARSAAIRMLIEMALTAQNAPIISSKIADDLGGFA